MSERELTEEEEAQVSELLATSAPPLTMPGPVAARLDAVLADLVAQQESPAQDDVVVVPITRRRWPRLLVAAAAVSLFGYAGGTMLDRGGSDAGSPAADTADAESANPRAAGPQPAPAESGGAAERDEAGGQGGGAGGGAAKDLVGLLESRLRDATALRRAAIGYSTDVFAAKGAGCLTPVMRSGETSFVLSVEKARRVVVVLSPVGAAKQATVYPCRQPLFPVATALVLAAR